ncbi:MAG: NosD domain-containing protein, partial [Candidatus Micrarchaeota archaeon]
MQRDNPGRRGSGTGINITTRNGTSVSGCTIANYSSGIALYGASSNAVTNNSISDFTYGIYVRPGSANSSYNSFENNNIGNGTTGIYLYDFANNYISYNSASGNAIGNCSNSGVFLEVHAAGSSFMGYNSFVNNSISGCNNSVRIYAGDNGLAYNQYNAFENNSFTNGTSGVYLDAQDYRHSLNFNNFTTNAFTNFSSYAVFFADNLTYTNDFGGGNTFDGFNFYHYAYRTNFSISGLSLNASNDASNIGMFVIANSTNVSLADSNITGDGEYGVFLWNNSQSSIAGSSIWGNGGAAEEANVYAFDERNSSISGNVIGSGYNGVYIVSSSGIGIHNSTIANATNSNVEIYGSSTNTMRNNSLANSTYGIRIRPGAANSYYNSLDNNTISGTGTGIYFYDFAASQIAYNNASGNAIANCTNYGVSLEVRASSSNFMGYNRFVNNSVANCTNAVRLFAGDNGLAQNQYNLFENNSLGGSYGIYLDVLDSRHVVNSTNFTGNLINATIYPVFFADAYTGMNNFTDNTLINDNSSNFIFVTPGANNSFSNTTFVRGDGRINFPQPGILVNRSVNSSNIVLGSDIASINSSNLTQYAGIPANVTTFAEVCPPAIFTKSGFPLTSADITANGSACSSPQCIVVSCASNLTQFSVANFSGYSANATAENCPIITAAGAYTMSGSYTGAPNSASPLGGSACVKIAASDVVLDCAGFNITNNGTAGTTYGIMLNNSASNVTVMNCPGIHSYSYGTYLYRANYSDFTNLSVINASTAAFFISEGHDNSFTGSYGNASGYGFYLSSTANNSLTNNTARSDNQYGFLVTSSSNNAIANSSILNSQYGIGVTAGANNSFYNNTMTINPGGYGFSVSGSDNLITGNTVNNSAYAYYFVGSQNNLITNNSAFNASNYGMSFTSASFNQTVINNTLRESGIYDFFIVVSNAGCAHTVQNNTGSGYRPIMYANTSVSWSDLEASEVFLCDADNSVLQNVSANGSDTLRNNAFFMFRTDNSLVNGSDSSDNYYSFYLDSSSNNSLANSRASNSSQGYGYYILNSANNTLRDNSANYSAYGFYLYSNSNDNLLSNNTANATAAAFYLSQVSGNNLTNNTAISAGGYGFYLYTAANGTITNNPIYSYYGAYLSYYSNNNTITNNAMSPPNEAFHLSLSSGNRIGTGAITGYGAGRGVFLESGSDNNTFANLSLGGFPYGVYLFGSNTGNNFTGDALCNNTYGTYIFRSNLTRLAGEHYCNNSYDFTASAVGGGDILVSVSSAIFDGPAADLTNYTNLSLSDIVSSGSSYMINWSNQSAALPAERMSFAGRFVNISNLSAGVSIDSLSWTWLDPELSGYDETAFELWKYNSSGWAVLNNTPNTSANILSLSNHSPASLYGILEENASCVTPTNDYYVNVDTVFCPGTYNLSDTGATGVIIANASGITITCDGTELVGNNAGSAFYASAKSGITIQGCKIRNYTNGIYVNRPNLTTITNNTIRNTTSNGIYFYQSGGSNYGHSTIENNTISGPAAGSSIYLYTADGGTAFNTTVRGNSFGNSTYGLQMRTASLGATATQYNFTLSGNDCSNTTRCFYLYDAGGGAIKYGKFENNTLSGSTYGIYIQGGASKVVENNFSGNALSNINSYGVYFVDSNTYQNRFWDANTFDGYPFYHYYDFNDTSMGNLSINASADATNLGLFTVVDSRNFTLYGSNISGDREYGIFFWRGLNYTVEDAILSGNGNAGSEANIYMYNGNRSSISNNIIRGGRIGIFDDMPLFGVRAQNNIIANTTSSGIYVDRPYAEMITNNTIRNASSGGIHFFYDWGGNYGYSVLENNTIDGPSGGSSIYFQSTTNGNMSSINVTNNSFGNSTYGLRMSSGSWISPAAQDNYRVTGNNCSNTTRCFALYATGGAYGTIRYGRFENNTISNSTYGIYLDGSSGRLVENNFTGNALSSITSYGVYFVDSNPYYNRFWDANTFDGYPFYHYYDTNDTAVGGLDINASADATNLGLFTVVRSGNFTFYGSNVSGDREYGAFLWITVNSTVENATFSSNGNAGDEANVYLYNDNRSSISNNIIRGGRIGIFDDMPLLGVQAQNNIIANTTSSGIYVDRPKFNSIANNTIRNTTSNGIYFYQSGGSNYGYSTIENNTISGPAAGSSIYLYTADGGTSYDVNVTNNSFGNSAYGLRMGTGSWVGSGTGLYNYTIVGNDCSNTTRCFYLSATGGSSGVIKYDRFEDNLLSNSTYGICLEGSPSRLVENNFSGNVVNASSYPLYFSDANPANNSFFDITLINDVSGNFIYNPGASTNYSNITFARNQGRINFPPGNISLAKSVNSGNTVLNSDIASINSTYLTEFAIPANVTTYAPQCPALVMWKAGFPTTSANIVSAGSLCSEPQCALISCSSNLVQFSVANFSGYTANITAAANVSAIKLDQTAAQPSPGGLVQFNMTVNNTGDFSLNVTVSDMLPSGLSFSSAFPANSSPGPVWIYNGLAPGNSTVFYINATVAPWTVNASVPVSNLTNYVNVTGQPASGSNVTGESYANVTVYYANVSVLKLDQTALQPSPGGIVQFNLTITNTGNVSLSPVELTDELPSGLTFVSSSPAPDSVLGQSIDWDDIGPLAPGASSVVYLNATVDAGAVNASVPARNLTNYVEAVGVPP